MTDKNHEKIWKEIKPHIDLIEGYMNAFIHLAQDMGNKEDEFRLSNLKRSFCRGIMMAASAKYLPMKNKPTREGYDFNAPAIVYCYEQVFSDIATKILDFHNGLTQDSFASLQIKNRKLWEEYFSFSGFINNLTSHLIRRIN